MTARCLGKFFFTDGDNLERSYKHSLSDFTDWVQKDHASDWILLEENIGERLSIDETSLQDDLFTFLSNKEGHCKKGTIVAAVRGTKVKDVVGVRGGNVSFGKFANDVRNVVASGDVLVTTMIDYFRLPPDFPGYTTDSMKVDMIERAIRDALSADVAPAIFLPYIQRHEFETLLFSNMDGFSAMDLDDKALAQLESIEQEYANLEDINGGAETAPSKRLGHIFNYEKAADSFTMLSAIPIDTIRAKCPRFNRWVLQLEEGLRQGRFQ